MVLLGIIVVVWGFSPIILIPLLVDSKRKQNKLSEELNKTRENAASLADRLRQLFDENKELRAKQTDAPTEAVQAEQVEAKVEQTEVPEETVTPVQVEEPKQAVNTWASAPAAAYVKPQKTAEEKKVSTISIMLTLGAILVSIAGIVFATTSWNVMGNSVRAFSVLSFSFIFFILSIIADKIGIPKTGRVFYTLGSVFLPITVIAAGYFSLFGDWFSFGGAGQPALWAMAMLSYAIAAFIGVVKFSSKGFAWSSFLAASAAVCSLCALVTGPIEFYTLAIAIYGLAITVLARFAKISETGIFSTYSKIFAPFAVINLLILSLNSLASPFADDYIIVVVIAAVLLAAAWYISKPVVNEKSLHAIPFVVFLTIALVKPVMDSDAAYIVFMFCVSAAVNIALSFVPAISESFGNVLRWIAAAAEIPLLVACVICAVADLGMISIFGLIIILGAVSALWLFNKKLVIGTVCKGFIPVVLECLIISVMIRAMDGIDYEAALLCFGIIAVSLILTVLFTFIKKADIESAASDICFGTVAVTAAVIWGFFIKGLPLLAVLGLFMAALTAFIPCVAAKDNVKKYVCTACGTAVVSLFPFVLSEQYGIEEHLQLIILLTALVMGAIAAGALVLTRNKEYPAAVNTYSIATLVIAAYYSISILSENMVCLLSFVPLAIFVCLRFIKPYGNKLYGVIRELAKYCLFGMNILFIGEVLYTDEFGVFPFAFNIGLAALITYFAYISENNVFATASVGMAMIAGVRFPYTFGAGEGVQYAIIAVLFVLSLVPSVLLHKQALFEKKDKGFKLDVFTAARPILVVLLYAVAKDITAEWACILFAGAVLLTFVREGFKIITNKGIACIAAFSLVIAWMSQPFFTWPDIIDIEMSLLPILVYFGVMVIVWKNTILQKAAGIAMFVVSFICYSILIVAALNTEEPIDALIITVSATLVLIYSFIVKEKKWFLLGGIIVLGMVFRMTRGFWASLDWWIYLLAAGLIFLGLGIGNEVRKKRADSHPDNTPEEKKTRFMSDWTW